MSLQTSHSSERMVTSAAAVSPDKHVRVQELICIWVLTKQDTQPYWPHKAKGQSPISSCRLLSITCTRTATVSSLLFVSFP